jgi:hypothetical protein
MSTLTLFHLAQSSPDISSVPADFVKNFLIMFGFVTIGAGAYIFGRRGSKGSPMHIEQPVSVDATVSAAPVHAHQSAVDELRQRMEAMARENMREHNAHRDTLRALLERGNERETSILNAIHDLQTTLTRDTLDELKDIHNRLNPLEAAVSMLKEAVENIKTNIGALWARVFAKPTR